MLFVEMLGAFLGLFEGEKESIAQLMELLAAVSAECEAVKDKTVQTCLCSARRYYFGQLVTQTREDEAAAYLLSTLDMYLTAEKPIAVWDDLSVFLLDAVAGLEDSGFAKCSTSSLQSICQLIEAESKDVRDHLILLLKRRLGP
jgi:hypothetical protein